MGSSEYELSGILEESSSLLNLESQSLVAVWTIIPELAVDLQDFRCRYAYPASEIGRCGVQTYIHTHVHT